jgi:hypothetical protein
MSTVDDRKTWVSTGAPVAARLELRRDGPVRAVLDGAWWPRSREPVVELSNLVTALDARNTVVRHVMLNTGAWDSHPYRIQIEGRVVRLGWFATLDASLLIADTDNDRRVDLLVVPFDATPVRAKAAMDLASSGPASLDAAGIAARTGPDPSGPGGRDAVDTGRRSGGA